MLHRIFPIAVLTIALSVTSQAAHAILVTYDVNLSANDPSTGHLLSVVGTIVGDTDKTDADAIVSTNLTLLHPSDDPIPLPSLPNSGVFSIADMRWVLSLTEMRFERLSVADGFVGWSVGLLPNTIDIGSIAFGTGGTPHSIHRHDRRAVPGSIHTLFPSETADTLTEWHPLFARLFGRRCRRA